MMKHRLTYLTALAAALLMASCTGDHDSLPTPQPQAGAATFRIFTRAQQGPDTDQEASLYVAERRKEDAEDELYCTAPPQDLGSGAYLIENMTAQWYKLAFVCVPRSVRLPEVAEGAAFNDITLDYTPVLERGTVAPYDDFQTADEDLAIYRAVIDRWLLPDSTLTEDVTLRRITGQLVLDMGVLKDQFAGQVTQIEVTLADIPSQVYLRDNANGEIIPAATETTEAYNNYTYTFPISPEQWESNDNFLMYFNLLPCTLGGTEGEEAGNSPTAKVTITRYGDNETAENATGDTMTEETYTLSSTRTGSIDIKSNTRTLVYFNGVENDEFVVRYAGFEGSGIGVDDDEWDGWD